MSSDERRKGVTSPRSMSSTSALVDKVSRGDADLLDVVSEPGEGA